MLECLVLQTNTFNKNIWTHHGFSWRIPGPEGLLRASCWTCSCRTWKSSAWTDLFVQSTPLKIGRQGRQVILNCLDMTRRSSWSHFLRLFSSGPGICSFVQACFGCIVGCFFSRTCWNNLRILQPAAARPECNWPVSFGFAGWPSNGSNGWQWLTLCLAGWKEGSMQV